MRRERMPVYGMARPSHQKRPRIYDPAEQDRQVRLVAMFDATTREEAVECVAEYADPFRVRIRTTSRAETGSRKGNRMAGALSMSIVCADWKKCPFRVRVWQKEVERFEVDFDSTYLHHEHVVLVNPSRNTPKGRVDEQGRFLHDGLREVLGLVPGESAHAKRRAGVTQNLTELGGCDSPSNEFDEWAARQDKHILKAQQIGRVKCMRQRRGEAFLFTPLIISNADEFSRLLSENNNDPLEVAYFEWWLGDNDQLVFLLIEGADALDVQRTLSFFHRTSSIFGNGKTEPWEQHAVFSYNGSNGCLLAIHGAALRCARMAMLPCVPIEYQLPQAPVLMDAWTMKSLERGRSDVRRHGMAAVLSFLSQHIRSSTRHEWARSSTLVADIHPIYSPLFAIYDYLPEFVSLLRLDTDMRMLTRMRDSLPGAAAYMPNYWMDSIYSLVSAFLFQQRPHLIHRHTIMTLCLFFRDNPDARHRHAIAHALVEHYRQNSDGMVNDGAVWQKTQIRGWAGLKLPSEYEMLRPADGLDAGEFAPLPHHFLYQLCFDDASVPDELRCEMAHRLILTDHIESMPVPGFSRIADEHGLGDGVFRKHVKNFELEFIRSIYDGHVLHGGDENVPPPISCRMGAFSTHTSAQWPLQSLFTLLATMQNIAWHPKLADDAVKTASDALNKRRADREQKGEELESLQEESAFLDTVGGCDLFELRGPTRVLDLRSITLEHKDIAFAYDKSRGVLKLKEEHPDKVLNRVVFYADNFFLSWPFSAKMLAMPGVDRASLEAYTFVRAPEVYKSDYLEQRAADKARQQQ